MTSLNDAPLRLWPRKVHNIIGVKYNKLEDNDFPFCTIITEQRVPQKGVPASDNKRTAAKVQRTQLVENRLHNEANNSETVITLKCGSESFPSFLRQTYYLNNIVYMGFEL